MDFITVLLTIVRVYEMLLLMRILLSWVPLQTSNKYVDLLIRVTDPVLLPAREIYMRIMNRLNFQMPIDLSPILVFLLINFLERKLITLSLY